MTQLVSFPGVNGTLYIFDVMDVNHVKVTDVSVKRDDTGAIVAGALHGSLGSIITVMFQATALDNENLISYYIVNDFLYIFIATSLINANNRIVITHKRGFVRTDDPAEIFDVFDVFLDVFLDYCEQNFASTLNAKVSKAVQKSVGEFEEKAKNNELGA